MIYKIYTFIINLKIRMKYICDVQINRGSRYFHVAHFEFLKGFNEKIISNNFIIVQ